VYNNELYFSFEYEHFIYRIKDSEPVLAVDWEISFPAKTPFERGSNGQFFIGKYLAIDYRRDEPDAKLVGIIKVISI